MSRLCCASLNILHRSNCRFSLITSMYVNSYTLSQDFYFSHRVFKSTSQKSYAVENHELRSQCVPFETMVHNRRKEAQKTILVQVHSEQSCGELYKYCSQFGNVQGIHHYSLPEPLHFALVEFQEESDVHNLLDVCRHVNKSELVPVRSPLLWFRAKNKSKSRLTKSTSQEPSSKVPLIVQNGNTAPTQLELRDMLQCAETFSDQILILHNATRLNDIGTRLRFLSAYQLELALSGLFPSAQALPFGSSVNGFGKCGCDLDLALQLDEDNIEEDNDDCRLVFHAKTSMANGRTQVQRHMETFGDICQLFLPGCSQVRRILHARVPIIKYKQDLMDIECDLSMTNTCAVYMSEMLYIMGSIDQRVRPLVFAIRYWAREVGLTNPTPGRWITNFSLTLLVLFFLQNKKILPTLNMLMSQARNGDQRITSDGINCTFLRDVRELNPSNHGESGNNDLETLLFQFFEFYSSFDFGSRAISLADGSSMLKPEHSPLYIVNPLERGLNVSKNISSEETERFKIELRNAAWTMESNAEVEVPKSQAWGLVSLVETPSAAAKGRNIFYLPAQRSNTRLMNVRELFEKSDDDSTIESKTNITSSKSKSKLNPSKNVSKNKKADLFFNVQKEFQAKEKVVRNIKSMSRRRR